MCRPRRCPLLVSLHGTRFTASAAEWSEEAQEENRTNLNAAIKQVLRRFAVDPDKIALAGRCASRATAMIWGR